MLDEIGPPWRIHTSTTSSTMGIGQAFPISPVFLGGSQIPLRVFVGLMLVLAGMLLLKLPREAAIRRGAQG